MSVSNRSANQNTARQLNHNVGFFFFFLLLKLYNTRKYKNVSNSD